MPLDHHLQTLADRTSGIISTIKRLQVPLAAYQDGHAVAATELHAIPGCAGPAQLHSELARAELMLLQHADSACHAASELHRETTPPPNNLLNNTTPLRAPHRIPPTASPATTPRMPRLFPPSLPDGLFDTAARQATTPLANTTAPVLAALQPGSLPGSLPGNITPLMTPTSLLQPSLFGLPTSPTAPRVIALPTGQSVVHVTQSTAPPLLLQTLQVAPPAVNASVNALHTNRMAVQLLHAGSAPEVVAPGMALPTRVMQEVTSTEEMPPPKKAKVVHTANSSTSDTTPTAGGGVGEPATVDAVESPAAAAPVAAVA